MAPNVALRKESVDRNFYYANKDCDWVVALRKESVDRNLLLGAGVMLGARSLSARRAWIEIFYSLKRRLHEPVALRKESVDRNSSVIFSAYVNVSVALRKESVDRNRMRRVLIHKEHSRSPQGERG